MSRLQLYGVAALVLLAVMATGLNGETKSTFISLTTIALWFGVGVFWLWIYWQSKSRKLFVSKVVVMLVALAGIIIVSRTLRVLDLGGTLIFDTFSVVIAAIIAIESYDLWRQSGRDAQKIDTVNKDGKK